MNLLELLKQESLPGLLKMSSSIWRWKWSQRKKNRRIYNEIRYTRLTSLSLKPTSSVFWLERKYQSLETPEYADNLISYLDGARTCRTITLSELSNVLHEISGKSGTQSTCSGEHDNTNSIGEHVVAFWEDFKWYLGVVEHFDEKGIPLVSYMIRWSISDSEWVFPEKAETLKLLQSKLSPEKYLLTIDVLYVLAAV